jgi:hypothetical protein
MDKDYQPPRSIRLGARISFKRRRRLTLAPADKTALARAADLWRLAVV